MNDTWVSMALFAVVTLCLALTIKTLFGFA